jgi:hypothetical protein
MRGDRRISLRLFFLLLISGGLMGWMVLVITAYYFVRVEDDNWARRNLETITNIAPAAGGDKSKTGEPAPAAGPSTDKPR